jgi:hypothetical protein
VKIEGEGLKHYASDKGPFLRYLHSAQRPLLRPITLQPNWCRAKRRSMINGHTVELSLAFRKSLLKIFKDPTR